MNGRVKPVRVTWVTAGQGMLAPALPTHQGINFQRGGKDFGAEGGGVSVERCRCMCRMGHGLCCRVASRDFPGSCVLLPGHVRLAMCSTDCTVHVYVCLWLLRSISLTVSAKEVLLACPALDWQQFGVPFSSSVVALPQELQMLVVLDYPSGRNFHTEKEKL